MANVKFCNVAFQSTFDNLVTKDATALYFVQETSRFYHGSRLMGTGVIATEQFAGLLSPEDYVALKALIAGGNSGSGEINLVAVDGSIVIDKKDNVSTIGVALSAVDGNMLSLKSDGLYVAEPKIPEYSIEKQETAEDGFAATYRLKKTVDGETSYEGDPINIARDLVLKSATLETVTEDGVPYADAKVGDPYIKMEFNDANTSALYIPVKDLGSRYVAGDGIEIVGNNISVKIAEVANGLVAVDGALTLNLATKDSAGAMSKEDKEFLDALRELNISSEYVTKDDMQDIRDSIAQMEESYMWAEM